MFRRLNCRELSCRKAELQEGWTAGRLSYTTFRKAKLEVLIRCVVSPPPSTNQPEVFTETLQSVLLTIEGDGESMSDYLFHAYFLLSCSRLITSGIYTLILDPVQRANTRSNPKSLLQLLSWGQSSTITAYPAVLVPSNHHITATSAIPNEV